MFCSSCGSPVSESANFCPRCGAPIKRPVEDAFESEMAAIKAVPTPPPPPVAQAAPPPVPQRRASTGSTRCPWCSATVDASQTSCPQCGATLQTVPISTESGWVQLPGRKDMAKIQFGNSFCQIEGTYVPVADMNLAQGDGVYFAHHVLLWKDPQVNVTTMSLKSGWKRLFSGMPLIMTQAEGPGHIAFSRDAPGELIALPLHPGQAVDVREHMFLAATHSVAYDWFSTNIWFSFRKGDETETKYPIGMFMDQFSAPQSPGLLLLHASGSVFIRDLAPGQAILIKPTALIFKDPTVQMHLHQEQPRVIYSGFFAPYFRHLFVCLTGPGRVAVQSVFEPVEHESANMTNCSYATTTSW